MHKEHKYWIYIVCSPNKSTIYIGVTNDLSRRLKEHFDTREELPTFAGRHYCYNLVYYEEFTDINEAISREKQLKGWSRKKKNWLIEMKNQKWHLYNSIFPLVQNRKINIQLFDILISNNIIYIFLTFEPLTIFINASGNSTHTLRN